MKFRKVIHMLPKDETLFITTGVVFNKSDYIEKIGTILDDKLKFQKSTDQKDLNNR